MYYNCIDACSNSYLDSQNEPCSQLFIDSKGSVLQTEATAIISVWQYDIIMHDINYIAGNPSQSCAHAIME